MKNLTEDLLQFLENAPTAFHAVEEIKKKLLKQGFKALSEGQEWKLKQAGSYFIAKEGSIVAFQMPHKEIKQNLILASHTDSPSFKLKPNASFVKEGLVMLGLEPYGGIMLNSWLNRDLGIAGKVLFQNRQGKIQESLINITDAVTIPQLAIHLDRKVNEEGLLLNKQEHVTALAAIHKGKDDGATFLQELCKLQLPIKELLAHTLFLYPLEKPSLTGYKGEFISAYRLDSLASVHAIASAFLNKQKTSSHTLKMVAFWDHEEIGSNSTTGADSPFFSSILERIILASGGNRESFLQLLSQSLCISVDLIHAVHPNYADRHDAQHKPKLGQGIVIKTHAQKRYATDIQSARPLIQAAKSAKIPYTMYACNNNIQSGTSIGPIQAALTGISTVDIGISQLSMHAARELIATKDHLSLVGLLETLLE